MNIKRFIILSVLLCTLISSTVLADSDFGQFRVPKNSNKVFVGIDNSKNEKTTNSKQWYLVATTVDYHPANAKKGEGMRFTPMRKGQNYYIAGGDGVWVLGASSGGYKVSWNGKGYMGEYYLGVRMDTIFNGKYGSTYGYWNTDCWR